MRGRFPLPGKEFIYSIIPVAPVDIAEVVALSPCTGQTILEEEADSVAMITTKRGKMFIPHLEFQTRNDNRMTRRMATYDYSLHLEHNMEVVSVVVYIGEEKLNMKNFACFNGNSYYV